MTPAKFNFTAYQAATFSQSLEWKSADVPVNLTGYTFKMHVKAKIADAAPLAQLTTENGGVVVVDAALGKFKLYATDETTADWLFASGVYDLLAIPASGEAVRILEGKITVVPGVTR